MNVHFSWYDRSTLHRMKWPDTVDGHYAKAYLTPLVEEGTKRFIRNVRTQIFVLQAGDLVLPVTVNETGYDNSYVCSPYTHYIRYAKQELAMLRLPLLEKCLSVLLSGMGLLLKRCRINKVVHINNWLLSTNLYPRMPVERWIAVLEEVKRTFPEHTVVFRSLAQSLHQEAIDRLRNYGCKLVPSRQIYLFRTSGRTANSKARWLVKRDGKLLEKHGYTVVTGADITDEDVPRIIELYNRLYLDKYSYHNPQFDESFIRLALRCGSLTLFGLRKEERLDAVLGFFCRDGVMTTPLFGYDTSLPQSVGLYRMLSAVLIRLARERGHLLHESAGAAQFKRNRGAVADIEYSAVFDNHLPLGRRWCWTLLEKLLNGIGVPLMRKFKL